MKLKFTRNPPSKPGYYWFCDFGEHTPVVLEVTKDSSGRFYAQDEEFSFPIGKAVTRKQVLTKGDSGFTPCNEGYYDGEDMWCYIPMPTLPNGKTPPNPNCY
jgi:hypothetical protein